MKHPPVTQDYFAQEKKVDRIGKMQWFTIVAVLVSGLVTALTISFGAGSSDGTLKAEVKQNRTEIQKVYAFMKEKEDKADKRADQVHALLMATYTDSVSNKTRLTGVEDRLKTVENRQHGNKHSTYSKPRKRGRSRR